jgi:hypothetical protein
MVIEKLNTEGVMYKPFKRENFDDYAAVDEAVHRENVRYKPKEFPEVDSTASLHVDTEEKKDESFTGFNGTSVPVDDTGAPATTPGKDDANDPFIILENGKSPSPASSVPIKDFPSFSQTPQNGAISSESRGGLSPSKSDETYDSVRTMCKKAIASGSKGNEGKRKRNPSKYYQSPYEQDTGRKRVKTSKSHTTFFVNVSVI